MAGLIPRDWLVFQTPPPPPESASIPRRGWGTTKARVLTSQEISDGIKQHDLERKMVYQCAVATERDQAFPQPSYMCATRNVPFEVTSHASDAETSRKNRGPM